MRNLFGSRTWRFRFLARSACAIAVAGSVGGCKQSQEDTDEKGPPPAKANALDPEDHAHRGLPAPPSQERQKVPPRAAGQLLVIEGNEQRTFRLQELILDLDPQIVDTEDPYYQRMKRFWAVTALSLIGEVYSGEKEELSESTFVVKAKDGYAVHFQGKKLLDGAAFFSFSDAEHPKFLPIGEQKADPAPLYLIWEGERGDLREYPRPWGIASIERVAKDAGLERTLPPEGFGKDAMAERGNEIFKRECIFCHCMNQQGGKVGPDLNVPQNILAYRPEAQVRQYIRDPQVFRYSNMPAHPDLTDEDLDALIAYLRVMGKHQIDPHVDVTPENAHEHD